MNHYDQIEDYLNGDLTGADLTVFEEALRRDPGLQMAVEHHRITITHLNALRLRGKIRENIAPPPASGASRMSFSGWLMSAAAVITVVLVATYFIYIRKETPLMADKPVSEEPPISDNTEPRTEIAETPAEMPQKATKTGTADISEKNIALYREAVGAMDDISYTYLDVQEQNDVQLEAKLNGIIDLLRSNRPEKAVPLLEDVLHNPGLPEAYREDAEWLLSVALIKRDRERSKEILRKIAGNPAHSCRVKAIQLLEKME